MTTIEAIEAARRAEASYLATAIVYGHGAPETAQAFRDLPISEAKLLAEIEARENAIPSGTGRQERKAS